MLCGPSCQCVSRAVLPAPFSMASFCWASFTKSLYVPKALAVWGHGEQWAYVSALPDCGASLCLLEAEGHVGDILLGPYDESVCPETKQSVQWAQCLESPSLQVPCCF
jgi:hypothetical protein